MIKGSQLLPTTGSDFNENIFVSLFIVISFTLSGCSQNYFHKKASLGTIFGEKTLSGLQKLLIIPFNIII